MPAPPPSSLVPLARLLEKDEPKVLVVVGAGVSVGATSASHASWLGLLKHGVEHLVATGVFTEQRGRQLNASLDAAFSPFDLERALRHAELVEQNLTIPDATPFAGWLAGAFKDFKIQAEEERDATLRAIRDLEHAGALVLTTNYDSLLSDATGLPPVTWQEHGKFLQVIRRQQTGILHIHGHWQRPDSVVLGKSSYDRIARDNDFQDLFKSLWLEWSWLYVGCGDGLDDPNLGRLLKWGNQWAKGTQPDYFLAKADNALALEHRKEKPENIVGVGYSDHTKLPGVLRSITPTARCWPFKEVDAHFALFRDPASPPVSIPFPSHQEYLDGDVPALGADAEVRRRLSTHRWAFVLDATSVGKTTLALRLTTAPEQRDRPSFYLDLATVDADDADAEASAALRRLSRPGWLLILDNVHHQPEVARRLWEQWEARSCESRLLLVGTRMQRTVAVAPAQDLAFFERHAGNPAVELRPTPDDLGRILHHIHRRIGGPRATPLPLPPVSALENWHRDYGSALGAFCLASIGHLAAFQRGNWDLPIEAASEWVREMWLDRLDPEERENALCLAVFGAQELELQVQKEALPHPGKTRRLLWVGLAAKTEVGRFGQYHRFSLREPSWGRLLLAAQARAVDEETILFDAAARHPMTAVVLSARFGRPEMSERLHRLWAYLANKPDALLAFIHDLPLSYFQNLVQPARERQQDRLANRLWEAIEREPDKLARRAWETPLHFVASFLDTAKRHGRDTKALWEAVEREPKKLADRAWETPLGDVASFLDATKRHGRDAKALWEAIEREPKKLADRAWETPLGDVASFLDTAKRHGRDTKALWEAIEREPRKLAARAWETPLHFVASFLDTAKRHERDTSALWEAIEQEPNKLAARAWETSLEHIASFLGTATRHERETEMVVQAIASRPTLLSAMAKQASVGHLAGFCHHAPDTLAKVALADFEPTHWDAVPSSESMAGAAWVAIRSGDVQREDLQSALITTLLRRANPLDFPPQGMSLANIAWLLAHAPAAADTMVARFLDTLCTKRWLGGQFTNVACGSLAAGLRALALHQPPEVCRRFWNPSLGIRLQKELARFARVMRREQSQIIQLLGCATLCGWPARGSWFKTVRLETIGTLPVDVDALPHRARADKVEDWQFQLWLGLRTVTKVTRRAMAVPRTVIVQTLDLWRANVAESSIHEDSVEHRVNQSMVAWLEKCLQANQGLLPPAATMEGPIGGVLSWF